MKETKKQKNQKHFSNIFHPKKIQNKKHTKLTMDNIKNK